MLVSFPFSFMVEVHAGDKRLLDEELADLQTKITQLQEQTDNFDAVLGAKADIEKQLTAVLTAIDEYDNNIGLFKKYP